MTTVQTMFTFRGARSPLAAVALGLGLGTLLTGGCETPRREPTLTPPHVLVAPYDSTYGEALWAVAPLGNESGVSTVDTALIADSLVAKLDEVRGVACLPLNRTLAAMRALNLRAVRSPTDARALANALGVDALVVGNVTAFDPYDPPKLGLSLALFSRDRKPAEPFDPMRLRSSYSDRDYTITSSQFADRPVATVNEHIDAANHEVLYAVKRYAEGRHDPDTALGWQRITKSMDLYTEFAAYFTVSRILEQERLRVGQPADTAAASANQDPR